MMPRVEPLVKERVHAWRDGESIDPETAQRGGTVDVANEVLRFVTVHHNNAAGDVRVGHRGRKGL